MRPGSKGTNPWRVLGWLLVVLVVLFALGVVRCEARVTPAIMVLLA